ncbi:hypothetical protein HOK51_04155 [Candidatus Woesearchaeota archaeon]|jgi:hypothetical protein|nr:hypothetical protein [Candidatus Woesearchaeota archaeon]MBT6519015.1 hypothetical protein [Candidatus Woesearchaeota archaeon]MBT7368786.1 hypothetical protein [Candidatus Woesearchaeota archaeon]
MNKLTEIMGIATISAGLIFAPGCIKKEGNEKTKTPPPQVELTDSETIEGSIVKVEDIVVEYTLYNKCRCYDETKSKKMSYITVQSYEGHKKLIYPWGIGQKPGIANITFKPITSEKNFSSCELINATHNIKYDCKDDGSTFFADGLIMAENGIEYKL